MTDFSSLLYGKTTLVDALPSPVQRQNSLKDWRVNRLFKSIRMGIAFSAIDQLTTSQHLGSVHDVLVRS